jgi:predicted nucleotidyltransferase component of viral defense system
MEIIMQPKRPAKLSNYAEVCLQALSGSGLGDKVSLGGAVGLMHYYEYRSTNDVDAWWESDATADERHNIVNLIEKTLRPYGEVHTRTWGDVVSVELNRGRKTVFSFQIAQRSVQLEPSQNSPLGDILIDSFSDLVASKMVALIERGAPRDFRDIFTLCQEGITTPSRCWQLWRRRQKMAGADTAIERARLAIETHLARVEQHRPLVQIRDESERQAAEKLRAWFKNVFLGATGT